MEKEKPIHAKPSLYAYYFEALKEIAKNFGYNLVLHGSLNRDLDLIAIPWTEELGDKDQMVDEFSKILGGTVLMVGRSVENEEGYRFSSKPHGRVVYIININRDIKYKFNGLKSTIEEYSDPQYYIDISIILPK